jgi:hypothetical protein
MAINVTLGEVKPQEEKPFPKLMKGSEGTLVMFFKSGQGTVISTNKPNIPLLTGEYYKGFTMSEFTDYNEPITLQNQ